MLDALSELPVTALPFYYIRRSTLVFSSKAMVVSLFALRLPCIVFLALATSEYQRTPTKPRTYDEAALWSEVLLGWSLSSASFPCIRTFLVAFLTESKYDVREESRGSHAAVSQNQVGRKSGSAGRSWDAIYARAHDQPPE